MGYETVDNGGNDRRTPVAPHVTDALAAACVAAGRAIKVGDRAHFVNFGGDELPDEVQGIGQNPVDPSPVAQTHQDFAAAPKWS